MIPMLKRVDANLCISPDGQTVFGYTKDGKEPAPWFLTVKSRDPSIDPDKGNVFVTEEEMAESIRMLTDIHRYQHERKYIYDFIPDPTKPHIIRCMTGVFDYSFYLYYLEPVETGTVPLVPPWERVMRARIRNDYIMDVSHVNIDTSEMVSLPVLMMDERFKILFIKEKLEMNRHVQGICYVSKNKVISARLENEPDLLHFLDIMACSNWSLMNGENNDEL